MRPYVFLKTQAIQFANDTVIISEAYPTTLAIINRILTVCAELSGLKINKTKSAFVLIALSRNMIQVDRNTGIPVGTIANQVLGPAARNQETEKGIF